jgi:hypothetical protein
VTITTSNGAARPNAYRGKRIGLCGFKGAGKDSFADQLVRALELAGFRVARAAFADQLRLCLVKTLGYSHNQLSDRALKEQLDPRWNLSPRQAMRLVGEAFRNGVMPDFWVRCLELYLGERYSVQPDVVIVTDVRNEYEADWIREGGLGKLALVRRPSVIWDGHDTESLAARDTTFFDDVVYNVGDLDALAPLASKFVSTFAEPWLSGRGGAK